MTKGSNIVVKYSSDYGQLSEEMWHFLRDIYGGGPEVVLKHNNSASTSGVSTVPVSQSTASSPQSSSSSPQSSTQSQSVTAASASSSQTLPTPIVVESKITESGEPGKTAENPKV